MVAIVSGNGLGLENSSLYTLGMRGVVGSGSIGTDGETASVNIANGNLVLQHTDDFLASVGANVGILRSYNSQGALDDDNGDNWRMGPTRMVRDAAVATRNVAGAQATRVAEDGSVELFTYNATLGLYRSTDGNGAYDTLSYNGSAQQWTFTDGASGTQEVYDGSGTQGRLLSSADANGNTTRYTYANGLLVQIADASGESATFSYAGTNLTDIRVTRPDIASGGVTLVHYDYDALNRLSRVTLDLTPQDSSVADAQSYWVSYSYDGTSDRVASVQQKDGSSLAVTYVQVGSDWRVKTLTDANNRQTTFSYDTVARTTTVTDPLGLQTVYTYDGQGQLTDIASPPVDGKSAHTSFGYDALGNLSSVTDALNRSVAMSYDGNGNLTEQRDTAGNTVRRTYDANNLLLTETVYATPDPDGAGLQQPSNGLTTRYAYDAQRNLRFEISATGDVTEHRYDSQGQLSATVKYSAQTYSISGLADNVAPSLAQLQAWTTAISDKSQIQLTEYRYDSRGQLSQVTRYSTVDSSGAGKLDGTQSVTTYVYDSFGHLLITATDGKQQAYAYDGLGRLILATDALNRNTSVVNYDDVNRTVTTTLLNGLTRTSVYDASGELVSVSESSLAAGNLGQTKYSYDADGRLRMLQTPSGRRSYCLYDALGRKVADIDADGSLTESVYDAAGELVQQISYATRVDVSQLVDSSGYPTNVTLSTLRPQASANDRSSWNLYDAAGRLVRTVDGNGDVSDNVYDGASRVVSVVRYAKPINVANLSAGATLANTQPVVDANDRTTRNFYDADGRLLGTLNADGYLTENVYDAAGRFIKTTAYATATAVSLRASGTLDALRPTAVPSADVVNRCSYDDQGRLAATIDAAGYLTRLGYDASGNLVSRLRYATSVVDFSTTPVTNTEDRLSTYHYDQLNRLDSEISYDGTQTVYHYDAAGNLISTDRAYGTSDLRRTQQRFDAQGRLVAELAPEHAALLSPSSSQAQIDAVFAQYATTYGYDADGHLIWMSDPAQHKTYYYYNADGQLAYTVNAEGDVERRVYDAFNELVSTTSYAVRLGGAGLASLTGGAIPSALQAQFDALSNSSTDTVTTYSYTKAGQLQTQQDALQYQTRFEYDAFGDITRKRQQIDAAGTQWQDIQYTYDHRGDQLTATSDPTGLNIVTVKAYDAFGRVTSFTDANLQTHTTQYDRLGRVIQAQDPLSAARFTTYDAFDRVLTQTDSAGVTTKYVYNRATRTVSITSAYGTADAVTSSITYNRFGQQYQVTDGNNNTTTYQYDTAGRLTRVSDSLGTIQTDSYDDLLGNLYESSDAAGVVTRYVYDAVNRVFTRTVDPNGIAATTTFAYDAKGNCTDVTDPNGALTRTQYDVRGQVKSVTVDPNGLALTTTYTYDGRGKTLTVTDPNSHTVAYAYDAVGRRTCETVDPNGLALQTSYGYDAEGNVAWSKDARGNYTRFVYDAKGRLSYTIDPTGAVTALVYDNDDRVVQKTSYANFVNLATLGSSPTAAGVVAEVARVRDTVRDHVEYDYYDANGRLRFSLDGGGAVTEQQFDANGNVTRRIAYAKTLKGAAPASTADIANAVKAVGFADSAHDRLTINFFDARNRVSATVDGAGAAKQFTYDGAGKVLATYAYVTPVASPSALTDLASLNLRLHADLAHDQQTRLVYDTAGRMVLSASAQHLNGTGAVLWSVESRSLDLGGRVIGTTSYANFLSDATLPAQPTQSQIAAWMKGVAPNVAADRSEYTAYDAANRVVFSVNAVGSVTRNDYDRAGNLIKQTDYVNPVALSGTQTLGSITSALQGKADTSRDRVSYAVFDAANRQVVGIDAVGAVTEYSLDALGNRITTTTYATLQGSAAWTLDQGYATLLASGFASWKTAHANQTLDHTQRAVYDADNRRTHAIDALGYVSRTDYDALGQVTRTAAFRLSVANGIQLNAATVDAAVGVSTNGALPSDARVDSYSYDARGLLLSSTDAMGYQERYTYDGVGNKLSYQNKNGAVWTYGYDARGHLVSETSPQVAIDTVTQTDLGALGVTENLGQIQTCMTYDALGNLLTRTEANGTSEARTTSYTYDAAGRQLRITYPAVSVYDAINDTSLASSTRVETQPVTLYTETTYDALGNAVVNRDVGGNYNYRSYDQAGRLRYEVDAEGGVTGYTLNAFGQNTLITHFNSPIGDPTARGGLAYSQSDLDGLYRPGGVAAAGRTITLVYDRTGRQVKAIEPQALVYDPARALNSNTLATAGKTTETTYDAFGQVVKTTVYGQDANGVALTGASATYNYYDLRGLQIATLAQVSAGKAYLTSNQYDQVGNLARVTEYATAVSGNDATWLSAAAPAAPVNTSGEDDRITDYYYDLNNRKTSEVRRQVLYAQNAPTVNARSDLVTSYGYDSVGNLTRVTDALGASTYTYYDALGRTTAVVAPEVPDVNGYLVRPYTQFKLDAYGNVLQQTAFANGAVGSAAGGFSAPTSAADDRTTTRRYDVMGHVLRETDPNGGDAYSSYDAFGRLAKQWRTFADIDGNPLIAYQQYTYDKLGRQIKVLTPATTSALNELPAAYHAVVGGSSQGTPSLTGSSPSYGGSPGDTSKVNWSGTNTAQVAFPSLGAGTAVRVVLKYHTGIYGTPGSDPYEGGIDTSQTFTVTSTDGLTALVSWTDSAVPRGGISAVTGYTLSTKDAGGNWVVRYDVSTSQLGDDHAQIVDLGQAAAGSIVNETTYNVFGEVVQKKRNGQVTEQDDYDAAGQIWRTRGADGITRGLLHDLTGQVTAEVKSSADLIRTSLDENEVASLRASQTTTETRYDLMGRVISQIFPTRAMGGGGASPAVATGLTWAITTGSAATPPTDYDTSYGQYPVVYSSYGGSLGTASRVDLQWTSLASLGSGDVSVRIDYVDSGNITQSQVREFRSEDTNTGAAMYWTAVNTVKTITHVLVSKKDASGNWVTLIDRSTQGNYGNRVVFKATPAFNDVDASSPQVTVLYRLQGSGAWSTASVAKGNLKDFGTSYLFEPTEALSGTYEYQVWYQVSGESAASMHDSGTMTLAAAALGVGGAATFQSSTSPILSWVNPGASQTEVFHYRRQGTSNWQQLAIADVGGGRLGVNVGGLADGNYEYELLYYASGSSSPSAHATGVFSTSAAKAAGQKLVVVNPTQQPLTAANAPSARRIEWAQPSGTVVTPHFHYRPTGSQSWIDLPVMNEGDQYAVDTTALGVGTYDYEIYYNDPSSGNELTRAGGTMTMAASGKGSISPVHGYVTSSPTLPELYVSNVSVGEGDHYAVFTVGTSTAVATGMGTSVGLALKAGTATTADFGSALEYSYDGGTTWTSVVSSSPTLTAGRTSFLVRTAIVDDTQLEANEYFTLQANALYGGLTQNSSAVGQAIIVDNDASSGIFDPNLPTINVGNISVNENAGTASFSVSLSSASASTVTVNYATADGTAIAGSDYVASNGTLTFVPGTTTQTVTVAILGQKLYRGNATESFLLKLSSPTNANLGTNSATGSITEVAPSLTVSDTKAAEGTYAVFDLALSKPSTLDTTVSLALSGGSATLGSDFSNAVQISTDGGVTWSDSVTSVTFAAKTTALRARVQTLTDSLPESDEDFHLTATTLTGYTANSSATGNGLISNVAPGSSLPTISVGNVSVNEGAGTATFKVSLSSAIASRVLVHYATADGTAIAGSDYTATSGTLTFEPGTTSQSVTVAILDDSLYEGATPETFLLNLSSPTNATLGSASATGSIIDNESNGSYGGSASVLSISNASAVEGSYAVFDLALSGVSGTDTTVGLTLYGGTATLGSDYNNAVQISTDGGATWSGNVSNATFAAGTTALKARVQTLSDSIAEPSESFNLMATTLAGYTSNSSVTGIGTIIDSGLPTIGVGNVSVNENAGTATFTVSLSSASASTVTVNYTTANGTAIAGSDYTATSGKLTFAPGSTSQTVTVAILDDNLYEGPTAETFLLNLSSPTNANLGSASATGSIADNEPYGGPALSISNASAIEGSYAMFDLALSNPSAFDTTVGLALYGGTATLGSDFNNTLQISTDGGATWSGNVSSATFVAGTTAMKARVQTLSDSVVEGSESFTLTASTSAGYTSNSSVTGTGTIVDNSLPAISVGNVLVNENAGTASFTVSLSSASSSTVTVNYSTANGTAIAGSDYTATSGTLTFAPGSTSQTVTVAILDDNLYEGPNAETFLLNLSSPSNATLVTSSATGSIADNEPYGGPALSISNASVAEGSYAVFDLALSNPSAFDTTVGLALYGGTATLGSDFNNAVQISTDGGTTWSGNVSSATFSAGKTALKARVQSVADSLSEGNENFSLTATTTAGYTSNSSVTGTGTILDSSLPTISVGNVSVNENAGTATFTVSLTNASTSTVTVNYATANGTAIAGSDYTATSGTLSFAPGTTSKSVTVSILDDSLYEGPSAENFLLSLSSPTNAALGTSSATGSIIDNEAAPSLSVSNASVTEGGYAVFDLGLSGVSAFDTTVGLALAGGTATLGSDFSNAVQISTDGGASWSGNVSSATFAAGKTALKARVQTLTDSLSEGNEGFSLTATRTGGYTANSSASGVGTIVDSSLPTISVGNVSVNENAGTATFTVTLSNASTSTVTVNYTTANGTAIAGSDYTATSGTLSFAAGTTSKTVTVSIIDDTIYEGATPETFLLNLSSPSNANLGTSSATGSITDNDSAPKITINDVSVNENAGTANFTVSLSNASSSAVTVNYATANGTATAGSDYTAKSGTLTFGAGVTSQTVSVSIIDDTLYEGSTPETYYVNLSSASGGTIYDSQGAGFIVDNDPYGSMSAQKVQTSLMVASASSGVSPLSAQTVQTAPTVQTAQIAQVSQLAGTTTTTAPLVSIPITEPLLQSLVTWSAPVGADAASSVFRYRTLGSYNWITAPITLTNGQMSAVVTSPGYGVVEYDVSFRTAGSSDEFAYDAGQITVGSGDPLLVADTGPRAASVGVSAQGANYTNTTTTAAGQVAISLPDTGLSSASLTSGGSGGVNVTPEMDFTLDRWGNRIAATDARNANWVTQYFYDQNNNLIKTVSPDAGGAISANSPTTQTFYDAGGRQIGTIDALGHINSQTLDAAGHVVTESHADGGMVKHGYDIFGDQLIQTSAEGHIIRYSYDHLGQMLTRTFGASLNAAGLEIDTWTQASGSWTLAVGTGTITSTYSYDALGHRITENDGAGDITKYRYDAAGNLVEERAPAGDTVRYAYNASGLKVAQLDGNGYYQKWNFDLGSGRLLSSRDLGGANTSYSYDGLGNLTQSARTTGLQTYQTWYRYDNAGQVLRVVDQASNTLTEYSYDAAGHHITERTTVGGQAQGLDGYYGGRIVQDNYIGYDDLGQMRYVADGVHLMMIDYDAAGNRTHVQTRYINDSGTARNYEYWYAYDAMNRQTVVDGVKIATSGVIDVGIDQGHRLAYDKDGNRISDITYGREAYLAPATPAGYGGDPNAEVATWKTEAGFTTENYAYDAAGRLTSSTRDGITIDSRHYDAAGRVVQSGAVITTAQRTLWSDATNKWQESGQDTTTRYDADGRAVSEVILGLDGALMETLQNYSYDAAGNLTSYQMVSQQNSGYTNTYTNTYARFGSYKQRSQAASSTLLSPGETDYTFDAEGNLIGVVDQKASINDRQFANDLSGRVLEKISFSTDNGARTTHRERSMIVNGEDLGVSGDDATEATRTGVDGIRTDGAFDLAWKQISASYPGSAPGAYTVAAGDTLQSIAKTNYGDASQWYRIAEANGLNFNSALTVGQVLKLPPAVGASNTASTYNPYDPMSHIGDTNPTMPSPAADGGCGAAGMLIVIVVVIVASILTAGAASGAAVSAETASGAAAGTTAGTTFGATEVGMNIAAAGSAASSAGEISLWEAGLGAMSSNSTAAMIGAAVGSVAGQVVGNALGVQHGFSWSSVAISALTAGISAEVGATGVLSDLKTDGPIAYAMAQSAIRDTANQGLAVVFGKQKQFNWGTVAAGVVAAGFGSAASQGVTSALGNDSGLGKIGNQFVADLTGNVVQNVTVQIAQGGHLRVDQIAADAFGNAFGQALVQTEASASTQESKLAAVQTTDQSGQPQTLSQQDLWQQNLNSAHANGLVNDDLYHSADMPTYSLSSEELHDGHGNRALGQYDPKTNTISIDQGLADSAVNDPQKSALLYAVIVEEQNHALLSMSGTVFKKPDGTPMEGGAIVAMKNSIDEAGQLIKSGQSLSFSLNDQNYSFSGSTLAQVIPAAFSPDRILDGESNNGIEDFAILDGLKDPAKAAAKLKEYVLKVGGAFGNDVAMTAGMTAGVLSKAWDIAKGLGNAAQLLESMKMNAMGAAGYLALKSAGASEMADNLFGDNYNAMVALKDRGIAFMKNVGNNPGRFLANLAGDLSGITPLVNSATKLYGQFRTLPNPADGLNMESYFDFGKTAGEFVGDALLVAANFVTGVGFALKAGSAVAKLSGLSTLTAKMGAMLRPLEGLEQLCGVGGKCFVAGTLVHTRDGLKPIESIQVGEMVLSQPEFCGQVEYRRVITTFYVEETSVIEVSVAATGGRTETFGTTLEHPFWVKDKGWTAAQELQSGWTLELHDGRETTVSHIINSGKSEPVFNFAVDGFHTYYVGEVGVWVHNACDVPNVGADAGAVLKLGETGLIDGVRHTRVGRWMSPQELEMMQSKGTVVQGSGGQTFISTNGASDFKGAALPGSVYAEFDVPASSLVQGGKTGWFKMLGPDAGPTQLFRLQKQGGTLLPEFKNVKIVDSKP